MPSHTKPSHADRLSKRSINQSISSSSKARQASKQPSRANQTKPTNLRALTTYVSRRLEKYDPLQSEKHKTRQDKMSDSSLFALADRKREHRGYPLHSLDKHLGVELLLIVPRTSRYLFFLIRQSLVHGETPRNVSVADVVAVGGLFRLLRQRNLWWCFTRRKKKKGDSKPARTTFPLELQTLLCTGIFFCVCVSFSLPVHYVPRGPTFFTEEETNPAQRYDSNFFIEGVTSPEHCAGGVFPRTKLVLPCSPFLQKGQAR